MLTCYQKFKNGVANCSGRLTVTPNMVYFGPQTEKIAAWFWPTQRVAIKLGTVSQSCFSLNISMANTQFKTDSARSSFGAALYTVSSL